MPVEVRHDDLRGAYLIIAVEFAENGVAAVG